MSGSLLDRFRALHADGHFIIPNPWDVGSARVLEQMGFQALATTSSGLGASLGKADQQVTLDELIDHVRDLVAAVDIPLSVDAEFGFADDVSELRDAVERLVEAGASGMSIEDYTPDRGLLDMEEAALRVRTVVEAAGGALVVTARAENHLYDVDDSEDTIARLQAYADEGADVLYAPGLSELNDFARLASELPRPVNALLGKRTPSVPALAEVGVRRMSVGGGLAFSAYGYLEKAAQELLDSGSSDYRATNVSSNLSRRAFRIS